MSERKRVSSDKLCKWITGDHQAANCSLKVNLHCVLLLDWKPEAAAAFRGDSLGFPLTVTAVNHPKLYAYVTANSIKIIKELHLSSAQGSAKVEKQNWPSVWNKTFIKFH